jgi:hypothetical protein
MMGNVRADGGKFGVLGAGFSQTVGALGQIEGRFYSDLNREARKITKVKIGKIGNVDRNPAKKL